MPQGTNSALNKFSSTLLFLLCGFFLSACNSTKNTTPFTPQITGENQAVVYIYRPNIIVNAMYSPGLNVDGEFRLNVKNGINSRITLAPGEHLFEFQNDNNYFELKPLTLILKDGAVYFLRIDASLKIRQTASYEPYQRNFKLMVIDEAQAIKEITACCMNSSRKPENKEKLPPDEKQNTGGFSVDKTQNPFSH